MALPTLPADGDNPWGAELRTALTDISNRADTGIANAATVQTQANTQGTQLSTNTTNIASNTSAITALQNTVSTLATAASVVNLTSNQTIGGTKTFSTAPVVPDSSFAISAINNLQSTLNAKAPIASPTFTGTVGGITPSMVGLANVDNTHDADKPVSTATQTALNLKANSADLTSAIQTHNHTGGVNGINIPIAAVTGLQTQISTFNTSIAALQPTLTTALSASSEITFDSAWTVTNATVTRFGQIAYLIIDVVNKSAISAGAVNGDVEPNILIGTFKSSSQYFNIQPGAVAGTPNQYPLAITNNHFLVGAFVDAGTSTINLALAYNGTSISSGTHFRVGGFFLLTSS